MIEDHRARVQALDKALDVLEAFDAQTPDLRASEISRITGMGKSGTQRTVHTLQRCGYLKRDPKSSALSLSPRCAILANSYLRGSRLIDLAMVHLVALSAKTGLRTDLWAPIDDDVINIARVPAQATTAALAPIGERRKAAGSAMGRVIQAGLQAEAALDEAPVDSRPAAELHCLDLGETTPREATFAAAVTGADGRCIAAVSVSGPTRGFATEEQRQRIVEAVTDTAQLLCDLRIDTWARTFVQTVQPPMPEMVESTDDDPLFISSVARGLRTLEAFCDGPIEQTLTSLRRATGYPTPTLQRLLATLATRGYVDRNTRHKTFRLSVRTLDLVFKMQMGDHALKSIWPRLLRLRNESGLRCTYCVRDGVNTIHLLHVQSSPQADFRTAHLGRRLPAVSNSGGLALLSSLEEAALDRLLEGYVVQPITDHTTTDMRLIREEIRKTRVRGYAYTDEQSIAHDTNIAAPVFQGQQAVGALVVSAPKADWSVERLEREMVPLLLKYARDPA